MLKIKIYVLYQNFDMQVVLVYPYSHFGAVYCWNMRCSSRLRRNH